MPAAETLPVPLACNLKTSFARREIADLTLSMAPGRAFWAAGADRDAARLSAASAVLHPDDWMAAGRYRDANQRRRRLATKLLLRQALSEAVKGEISPSTWRFANTAFGKPLVAVGLPALHFSLSHSQNASVVAVSRDCEVGVDIEPLDQCLDENVITSFLSTSERAELECVSQSARTIAAIQLWTLKEAYVKMLGCGVAADFSCLSFDLRRLRLRGAPEVQFHGWTAEIGGSICQISLCFSAAAADGVRRENDESHERDTDSPWPARSSMEHSK